MASKQVHTRANPDPEPVAPMSNPKKLLHKGKKKIPDPFYYLDRNMSLPKDGVESIDDLEFNLLFEQTLFRSKSKSYLKEIIFDEKKFQSVIPTNPPHKLT